MNALKMLLLGLLVSSFVSCSKIQTWKESISGDSNGSEVVDEFADGDLTEDGEEDGEEDVDGAEFAEDETVDEVLENAQTASEEYSNVESEADSNVPVAAAEAANEGGMGEYLVQENDTLMWISFKLYGDHLRWRDIQRANPGLSTSDLNPGMKLQYPVSEEEFNWSPEGKPYLIVNGDTLGVISDKVYGTMKKWESIWHNNRRMIKDPNLIFAGFTIYYLEDGKLALNGDQ